MGLEGRRNELVEDGLLRGGPEEVLLLSLFALGLVLGVEVEGLSGQMFWLGVFLIVHYN